MCQHEQEDWVCADHAALIELEHAKAGRILDARTENIARVEKLHGMLEVHEDERRAIADALNSLRILELEEVRHDKEEQQRALNESLKKLRSIAPAVLKTEKRKEDRFVRYQNVGTEIILPTK